MEGTQETNQPKDTRIIEKISKNRSIKIEPISLYGGNGIVGEYGRTLTKIITGKTPGVSRALIFPEDKGDVVVWTDEEWPRRHLFRKPQPFASIIHRKLFDSYAIQARNSLSYESAKAKVYVSLRTDKDGDKMVKGDIYASGYDIATSLLKEFLLRTQSLPLDLDVVISSQTETQNKLLNIVYDPTRMEIAVYDNSDLSNRNKEIGRYELDKGDKSRIVEQLITDVNGPAK